MSKFKDYEALFDASPVPSLILLADSPRYTIIEANDAYCRATQNKKLSLIGTGLFDTFPSNAQCREFRLKVASSLRKVVSANKSDKFHAKIIHKQPLGALKFELKYCETENSPLLNEEGNVSFILHSVTDMTNLVIAEQNEKEACLELAKTNQPVNEIMKINKKFHHLLQYSTEELALLAVDGTFLEITETGKNILSEPESFFFDKQGSQMMQPKDRFALREAFINQLNQPTCVNKLEFQLLLADATFKWIEVVFLNYLNEPAVNAMVMTFKDVTERNLVFEKLRSSETRSDNLFRNNPLPMWIYDPDTFYFLEVNKAAIQNYGYSLEEFRTMKITEIRDIDREEDLQITTAVPNRSDGYWRHLKKNGELLYVDKTSRVIDHQGRKALLTLAMTLPKR